MKFINKPLSYLILISLLTTVITGCKQENPDNATIAQLIPLALRGTVIENSSNTDDSPSITPVSTSPNENPSFPVEFTATGASFQTQDSTGKVVKITASPGSAVANFPGLVDASGNWVDLEGNPVTQTGYNGTGLYDNLTIIFGSPMNKASVEANFTLTDAAGNPVAGEFIWSGDQHLQFDPYLPLAEDTVYTLNISNNAKVADGITNATFPGFSAQFKTGSNFNMSHTVSGKQTGAGGDEEKAVLIKTGELLNVSSTIPYPERVQYIRLYKLGSQYAADGSEQYYTICDKTAAVPSTCPGTINLDLAGITPSALQPSEGGNTYYYCVNITAKVNECNYIRTFSFNYGNVAADPNAAITDSIAVTLQEASLNTIESLVQKFATEAFTLEGKSLNGIINESVARNFDQSLVVSGQTCRSVSGGNAAYNNNFKHLSKIGPFCNELISSEKANLSKANVYSIYQNSDGALKLALGALFVPVVGILYWYNDSDIVAYLTYDAGVDVYIHEMKIPPSPSDVMRANLEPTNSSLDVSLAVRKANGEMTMVLEILSAKMSFLVDFGAISLPDSLVQGKYMYTTPFAINLNQSPGDYRNAALKTSTAINGSKILILTNPPTNYSPSDNVNFNYKEWNDNLSVQEIADTPNHSVVNSTSSLAQLIAGFLTPVMKVAVKTATLQKLPDIQPKVVGGVVKDTVEKAVPDLLNTIIDPFTKAEGYPIAMPTYLPEPFNTLSIRVKGTPSAVTPGVDGTYKALEARINSVLTAEISKPNQPKPAGFVGDTDSYITITGAGIPLNGVNGSAQIKSANLAHDGLLASINPNVVNQSLYHLWKAGAFHLTLDKTAISTLKEFVEQAGTDTALLKLGEDLLKAGPLLTVFAPGRVDWNLYDATSGTKRKINLEDPVYIVTRAIQTPVVMVEGGGIPTLNISISDLILEIRGGDPKAENYLISKIRTNMTIKSEFKITKYQNAKNIKVNFYGKEIEYSSTYSLRIEVPIPVDDKDVSKGVFYSLEVLKAQGDNPLGLNPNKMTELVKPLVRTLILPLMNNLLGDIPLPPLKACGLEVTDPEVLPVAAGEKYIFIKAKLQEDTVPFTGDCSVKTILDLN
ncbi:MAG: Ig-like domain-containing protein [Leptospiraceae bacterium]|nr:Ig-like domain-containing protein [Leptospiraceae bacterium]MCP5503000.1 Ig-like domain-containing protein [Leptospiraceae bacterium]